MTPERKKYLDSIPAEEKAMREHITVVKWAIARYKKALKAESKILKAIKKTSSPGSSNNKANLKANQRILKLLKLQLPQSLPPNRLRRCPFCGSKEVHAVHRFEIDSDNGKYVIYCSNCHCRTTFKDTYKEVLKTWNNRF